MKYAKMIFILINNTFVGLLYEQALGSGFY